jgi:hypothetical protein
MVTVNEHDHGHDECPGCRFRRELARHLARVAVSDEDEWNDATAGIALSMAKAAALLVRLRAERLEHLPIERARIARRAAWAISRAGHEVQRLWEQLMPDNTDEESQGADDHGGA